MTTVHPKHDYDGFWYRAHCHMVSVADEYGDHAYSRPQFTMFKYAVLRETAKGVFLLNVSMSSVDPDVYRNVEYGTYTGIFIRGKAVKQYAVPTRALAITDCLKRLERRMYCDIGRAQRAAEMFSHVYRTADNAGIILPAHAPTYKGIDIEVTQKEHWLW